jgi:hypothetical protein
MRNHGTIDGELTVAIRQNTFVRITNQRSNVTVLTWTTGRYGDNNYTITMLMLGCERKHFRLTLTTTTTQ